MESIELLKSLNFTVIDLETTGGSQEKDKIIEIGMVRIREMQLADSRSYLVDPQKAIPEFIQKLTSISQADTKGKPIIDDIIDEVIEFIGDDILVAHNTSFDIPFLNSVLKRLDRPVLKNKVICTNVMTKHMIPEILASNLHYMSGLFNIGHENAHRAQDDALASAKLLIKYMEIFAEKGIKKVNQLYYPKNKFELDRMNYSQETSADEILSKIAQFESPLTISLKGERGLILGVLPLNNPSEQTSLASEFIKKANWTMLTLKLNGSYLEGLLEFNNHIGKYTDELKQFALNYIQLNAPKDVPQIELDFVLTHHLVYKQVLFYSFLHLNTNTRNVFKIPSHKKKLLQFFGRQVKNFKAQKKERHTSMLAEEVRSVILSYLKAGVAQQEYLNITLGDMDKGQKHVLDMVDHFCKTRGRKIRFPNYYL